MRKKLKRKQMLAGMLSAVLTVTALPLASLAVPQKEVKAASVTLQNPRIVKDDSMKAGQKVRRSPGTVSGLAVIRSVRWWRMQ